MAAWIVGLTYLYGYVSNREEGRIICQLGIGSDWVVGNHPRSFLGSDPDERSLTHFRQKN